MLKSILIRFAELCFVCVAISAAISALFCIPGLFTTAAKLAAVFLAADILFLIIEVYLMRRCFFLIHKSVPFFIINYSAQALFALVNFIAVALIPPAPYTWLFAITKTLSVSSAYNVSNVTSAVIFHLLLAFILALSPMGMDRVILDDEIRRSGGDFYKKKK